MGSKVNPACASAGVQVSGKRALSRVADAFLTPSTAVSAIAGLVTALSWDASFIVATSASALAVCGLGFICTVVRACLAVMRIKDVAKILISEVGKLRNEFVSHLLPIVISLSAEPAPNQEALLDELGRLAGDLDTLVGDILHLMVSKRAQTREAVTTKGELEDTPLVRAVKSVADDFSKFRQKVHETVCERTWEQVSAITETSKRREEQSQ